MGIPVAKSFTATNRGLVLREVTCEKCNAAFVYALSREAVGTGTSLLFLDNQGAEERAVQEAEQRLATMLDADVDPIPCPKCGLYQSSMVEVLRGGAYWWIDGLAYLCFVLAFVCFLVLLPAALYDLAGIPFNARIALGLSGGLMVLVGLGFMQWRRVRRRAYDPNAPEHEEVRVQQQRRELAMLKDEVEKEGPDRLIAPITRKFRQGAWGDLQFNLMMRLAIALFFVGLGVVLLFQMRQEIVDGLASPGWPATEATVVSSHVATETSQQKQRTVFYYSPVIAYQYEANGQQLTAARFRFEPYKSQDQQSITQLAMSYRPGMKIQVHFKPSDPATAVIIPGLTAVRIVVALGLLGCAIGGAGFFVYELRRYLRLRSEYLESLEAV